MKLVADLHTHSIASTHAYATITEMAQEASELGLFALAITDHARKMPGAPGPFYFESLCILPQYLKGVRLLRGIEANICDYDGNLDVENSLQNSLDWIVASMHTITIDGEATVEKCTNAYLKLAENPNVNVIGHSGSEYFKYDYETVIPKFAKEGKLVEINDSAFRNKKSCLENCVTIAKLCKKYKARICVDTDSHFTHTLGRAYETLEILKDIDFPESLIVNTNVDRLKAYFDENNIAY
ncbi:MAG: phosphatase [Ruminococcus sp.]|nr:phosphatase [Ruminococcus sp.]